MTNPLDFYEQDIVFHKIYYFLHLQPNINIFFCMCVDFIPNPKQFNS